MRFVESGSFRVLQYKHSVKICHRRISMKNNHIKDQAILNRCIQSCEATIDACQTVIDMCSTAAQEECASAFGMAMGHCRNSVEECKKIMAYIAEHKESCSDTACVPMLTALGKACHNCMESCSDCITKCKTEQEVCTESCLECIDACSACAQACQEALSL